jgi:hypothetical protein
LITVRDAGDVFAAGAGASPFDIAEAAVHANQLAGGVGDGGVGGGEVGDAVIGLFLTLEGAI